METLFMKTLLKSLSAHTFLEYTQIQSNSIQMYELNE